MNWRHLNLLAKTWLAISCVWVTASILMSLLLVGGTHSILLLLPLDLFVKHLLGSQFRSLSLDYRLTLNIGHTRRLVNGYVLLIIPTVSSMRMTTSSIWARVRALIWKTIDPFNCLSTKCAILILLQISIHVLLFLLLSAKLRVEFLRYLICVQ